MQVFRSLQVSQSGVGPLKVNSIPMVASFIPISVIWVEASDIFLSSIVIDNHYISNYFRCLCSLNCCFLGEAGIQDSIAFGTDLVGTGEGLDYSISV